ncbi:MarR family transcriptional regulator [Haladaptatus sp. DYF46]|uniref:DUF7504 family protein n=1 Tax=Haladaptatus sp. DYF46 TaxID=2886041 RepID=UPI001E2B6176|nr:MarR family transcriptional regulator [Haladaptatus sp. DYF46]
MIEHTNVDALHGPANVLVLTPLTPDGHRTHLKLVASASADEIRLAAVTYTQSPQQWLADWQRHIGSLPHETHFIHANGMVHADATADQTPASVTTEFVDPTDPMEIIVPLSQQLQAWTNGDTQRVVSMQTLTILLEYIDFDTAFRYLHVLTHRIRAAGATGYFQVDPDIHDPETINTLESLFDVVVEVSDGNVEWTLTSSSSLDTETTLMSETTGPSTSREESAGGLLSTLRSVLSTMFDGNESNDDQADTHSSVNTSTATPTGDAVADQSSLGSLVDEDMLTDDERIRSLLIQYRGRMKQADITAEAPWSKSTVSRKLRTMEEDGTITRVQVGRENLVFLDGAEPDAANSPFEA